MRVGEGGALELLGHAAAGLDQAPGRRRGEAARAAVLAVAALPEPRGAGETPEDDTTAMESEGVALRGSPTCMLLMLLPLTKCATLSASGRQVP